MSTFKEIVSTIVGRNTPAIQSTINALFAELDLQEEASLPTTHIDTQDVESAMEAIKVADANHKLSVGNNRKLLIIIDIINQVKAPTTFPPVLGEWETAYSDYTHVNVAPPVPPPPPPPAATTAKLDKPPVSVDSIILDNTKTLSAQATDLMQSIRAWAWPQHASGAKLVSTTRGPDGKLVQVIIDITGAEEQLNRHLHSALTTIIQNSPSLRDRVPEAPTGRELWVNTLNTLVPPHETLQTKLALRKQLGQIHFENFDCPEALLAARNNILRQSKEFGTEIDAETKYFSLLEAIPVENPFEHIIMEFQAKDPSLDNYDLLESRFLAMARLKLTKDPATKAIRAATKVAEEEQEDQVKRLINALESQGVSGGGKKKKGGGSPSRGSPSRGSPSKRPPREGFIPPELFTEDVAKKLKGLTQDKYDEINAIKAKFAKGLITDEASAKGSQKPPDTKTAHRTSVRPVQDNADSPLTAFTTTTAFDKCPSVSFDQPSFDY
jgi:hypothetical protein